jgi:hypothetical protein
MSTPPEAKQQNNDNARAEDLEDWSLTFPSDLPESVAFEIPLEKKVSIFVFHYQQDSFSPTTFFCNLTTLLRIHSLL